MAEAMKQLEMRIAHLEKELRDLKATLAKGEKQGWERIVGSHEDDPTFPEFLKEMKRQRRADERRAAREASVGNGKKPGQGKRKKRLTTR